MLPEFRFHLKDLRYSEWMAQGKPLTIVGFHQDEQDDWVADLSCGHTQHVRHCPPWILRPWVISDDGRKEHLGATLFCKQCEDKSLTQL